MEKKTVLQQNIHTTLLNPVSGGSQVLSHTKEQQKELVSGRHFLKLRSDYSKLFIQPVMLSN